MSYLRLLSITCAGTMLLNASHLHAQDAAVMRLNSPQFEAEASKLRSLPTRPYEFSKAVLGDVIRFLATDAGISFFSLPEGSPEGERLITFSLKASPFQALETLTKANGLSLILDGGIWYVRPADDAEMIGRSYEVKYNSMEHVTKSSSGSTGGGDFSSGGSSGAGGSSPFGGGSSGGGGGVDLQGGGQNTFMVQRSELINDIRSILDLASETANGMGGNSMMAQPINPLNESQKSRLPLDSNGNVRKPKIIWKSDSNTLYVVATRLQHMWVEGFLAAADRPQALIAIEMKFFETSRDPSSEFGLDWSGSKFTVGLNQVNGVNSDNTLATSDPTRSVLLNSGTIANAVKAAGGFSAPLQAVLSAQNMSATLHAMLTDSKTTTTSYPRMVTTNNREVVFRSVVNEPVLAASSSVSSGTGGQLSQASVSYLPIGTVVNILPKKIQKDRINLNLAITVSSIIGTQTIQGNPYPIASSRVYSAPVEINDRYTVAIGGLEEATDTSTDSGVPVLSKIPLFGYLFKTRTRSKDHKNMLIFITPTLIDSKDGGISEEPQSVLPRKPDALMPHVPKLAAGGGIEGGIAALPNAVAFMKRASDEIGMTIDEYRGTKKEYTKLNDLAASVRRLQKEVDIYITNHPEAWDELSRTKAQLEDIRSDITRHRIELVKKGYY